MCLGFLKIPATSRADAGPDFAGTALGRLLLTKMDEFAHFCTMQLDDVLRLSHRQTTHF